MGRIQGGDKILIEQNPAQWRIKRKATNPIHLCKESKAIERAKYDRCLSSAFQMSTNIIVKKDYMIFIAWSFNIEYVVYTL